MRDENEIDVGKGIAEGLARELLEAAGAEAVLSWGPREMDGHSTKRLPKSAVRSVDRRFRTLSLEVTGKIATVRFTEESLAECDRAGPDGVEMRARLRELIATAVEESFGWRRDDAGVIPEP